MKKRKRIIVVVESIDINDSSGSKANVALIKNLSLIGFKIKVYHYTRKFIEIDGVECIQIPEKKYNFLYILSRSQRLIQRHLKINLANFFESIFGFSFTFFNDINSIKDCLENDKNIDYDLILTLSKGASFRPHYAILKTPQFHKKWITYIHDPYPFHYYPKPFQYDEPGYKIKVKFFKNLSIKARFSAYPSELLKTWMIDKFPNFKKGAFVIPHQHLEIKTSKNHFPDFFDVKKFTLLHAGSLLNERSPKGLIEGFSLFLKNNATAKLNAKLILLGNVNKHQSMIKEFEKNIKELYCSYGNVNYETVNFLQNRASVNIILESKAKISPFLPGKFPHCVLANRPILLLSPKKSESNRLLGKGYLYSTEVDNVSTIANKIEILYNKWETSKNEFHLNREDLRFYFSKEHLLEIMSSI